MYNGKVLAPEHECSTCWNFGSTSRYSMFCFRWDDLLEDSHGCCYDYYLDEKIGKKWINDLEIERYGTSYDQRIQQAKRENQRGVYINDEI